MTPDQKNERACEHGHNYYKSGDCPTCPVCEKNRKPQEGFLSLISAPARRALEHEGISTLALLSGYSEKELLRLHGIGPGSMPRLRASLQAAGLEFKKG